MKRKLMKYFACMSSAAVLLTTVLVAAMSYQIFEQHIMDDLRIEVRMVRRLVERDELEQAVRALGSDLRMTLIDPQGVVLFDNEVSTGVVDNHALRPEFIMAREEGVGTDVRQSTTLEKSTYYYAVRLDDGCVLRVAEESDSILSVYMNALPTMLLIIAMMIALCFASANIVTRRLVRPIERMTARLETDSASPYPELEPFMSKIARQHEEILRSADMRVQFTANVSHELKTPLTSISGYAELIESGMAQGEETQRFAGEICKSARRLLSLINDIIRLSQMDSPTAEMNLEVFDAAQVAQDVIEQLRMGAHQMDVSLQLEGASAFIEADRRMVEELIYNLCDNAIRYNVRGGRVVMDVHPEGEKAVIRVCDTGIGISEENQDRVFERFYRVDKSRSKATGGTGLGLAIVKHIAARHHAALSLESELGRGTSITVVFDGKKDAQKERESC